MAVHAPSQVDRERIRELTEREERTLNERTPMSRALYERARTSLAGGVASSYQLREPWPIYLDRGEGARVWDVDGNELLDFHNGFGSMTQGHAHPAITRAVESRIRLGTHFAAPTEDAVAVAEHLQRRWGLPKWRYTNSGTEATMDAVRIARGLTGRDTIVKIFGSYHGHNDALMVSTGGTEVAGMPPDELPSIGYGAGLPPAVVELTVAVPFNDIDAMERRIERLESAGRAPACVIMEAAMMNLGIIPPEPGYLEAVRELTKRRGIVLLCDEVMRVVEEGRVYQVGTFNGNPLSMAAARANLEEVLTPAAYEHLDRLNERILAGCSRVIDDHALPGYAIGIGAKGCVTFSAEPIVDYATFKANQDAELTHLAWLYSMNRGIFMTPGREEEWTLTVAHDDAAVDKYTAVFAELAAELTS